MPANNEVLVETINHLTYVQMLSDHTPASELLRYCTCDAQTVDCRHEANVRIGAHSATTAAAATHSRCSYTTRVAATAVAHVHDAYVVFYTC